MLRAIYASEPFGRFISIPALLVGQDHFHNIVAEFTEIVDKFWKHAKVRNSISPASLGYVLRWRQLQPIRLAGENDSLGAKAFRQKLDSSRYTPADPRGADTGCHTNFFTGDIAGSVAVNELDSVSNSEFFGAAFCLRGKQLTHVYAKASNFIIAFPGTQHLTRTAAEI